ncbi:hypothetical protein E2986_09841 [Frieseomelitta varia]|uniref:RRM domain-containing protein n=1 Tax=Frieseomelitta varia TaxID=561572 RepID=A0A833W352_9HYME|nr:uncharacterized protein LOC122535443 [Frieseomelitta varia]KAF3422397.1 hypothetical protein E2986_09841 [Frieseomelitta varia]
MEYEKYYDKRANGYVIHFPNNKGLSLQEITKMFSAFGKIVSVNNRGKSNGLCFVRYETVEDAKKCIDGFRNNSSIKILPHKIKTNIIDINTNIEAKDVDANAQDKRMFKQNIYKNNSEENNHFSTYSSTKQSQNTQTDNQSNCNLSESSSKDNFNDDVDVDGKNKTNHLSPIPKLSSEQRIRLRNLKKFASNTSISSAVTNTSRELEDIPDETNIPALVHIDQKYETHNINITPSVKIVPAYEVIVANIHPSLTIHYMLHLFEKFNPISISLMMSLPKTNILYCHVYFKTYEDAYATMKQFDMHNVHGKKLIVLTSNKLMEEISQL